MLYYSLAINLAKIHVTKYIAVFVCDKVFAIDISFFALKLIGSVLMCPKSILVLRYIYLY